jgi:predicted transcriptional regulator
MKWQRWTDAEIDILTDRWGIMTTEKIAKKLNRTYDGVRLKAVNLGLGNKKDATGYLTLSMLSKACGISWHTTKKWTQSGLQTKRSMIRTGKNKIILIDPEDFWKFAEENKNKINFNKIQKGVLLPEPVWFKKFIIDKNKQLNKSCKTWTQEEEKQLINLFHLNYKVKDIAKKLNRSESGVYGKLAKFYKNGTLKNKKHYKNKIYYDLIKLENNGLTDAEITKKLKCSRDNIVKKRKKMRELGIYIGYKEKIWRSKRDDKTIS